MTPGLFDVMNIGTDESKRGEESGTIKVEQIEEEEQDQPMPMRREQSLEMNSHEIEMCLEEEQIKNINRIETENSNR